MHVPCAISVFWRLWLYVLTYHAPPPNWYSWVISISHSIKLLHCSLCMTSQCYKNNICDVTSRAPSRVPLSSSKQLGCGHQGIATCMIQIGQMGVCKGQNFQTCSREQHKSDKVISSMHGKSENICGFGIWQWTIFGWCYSIALEAAPFVLLSNTSLECFIVKYHKAVFSHYVGVDPFYQHGLTAIRARISIYICVFCRMCLLIHTHPDSKIYVASKGPTWGQQDTGGPHVGPMNIAIWANIYRGVAKLPLHVMSHYIP